MSQRDDFFQLLQKLNTQHANAQINRPRVLDLPASGSSHQPVNIASCGATTASFLSRQLSQPLTSASDFTKHSSPSSDAWNKLVAVNFGKPKTEAAPLSQGEVRSTFTNNDQNAADASSLLRILQQASNKPPPAQIPETASEGMLAYQCDDQHQLNVSKFIKRNCTKSPATGGSDTLKISSHSAHAVSPSINKSSSYVVPAGQITEHDPRHKGSRRRYSSSGERQNARYFTPISATGSSSEELDERDSSTYLYCSDNSDAPIIFPPTDHRQRRNFVSVKQPSHPYGISTNRPRTKTVGSAIKQPEWDDFDFEKDFDFDANLKLFDKKAFCQDAPQMSDPPQKLASGDKLRSLLGIKNTSATASSAACPSKDYRPTGSSQENRNSVPTDTHDPAILYSYTTHVNDHESRKIKDNVLTMSSPSTEEDQEYADYDDDEAGHDFPCKNLAMEHPLDGDSLLMSAAQLLSTIALPQEGRKEVSTAADPNEKLLLTKCKTSMPRSDFFQVDNKSCPSVPESTPNPQSQITWSVEGRSPGSTVLPTSSLQISGKVPLVERDTCIEKLFAEEIYGGSTTQTISGASAGLEMIQLASRDVSHYLMRLIRKCDIQITPVRPIVLILDSANISSVICLKALHNFLLTFNQCRFTPVDGTLAYVYCCTARESLTVPLAVYANSLFQSQLAKLTALKCLPPNSASPLVYVDNPNLPKDTHASISVIVPPSSASSLLNFNLPTLSGSDAVVCVDFPLHMNTMISQLSPYYHTAKHLACLMLGCGTCLPWEWSMFVRAVNITGNTNADNIAVVELPGLLGNGTIRNVSDLMYDYIKLFFASGCSLLEFVDVSNKS